MPSPEVAAKIQTIEAKLVELDPLFRDFCSRYGFNLRNGPELNPRRMVWRREEIDRVMDLCTDLSVPEIIERGFYPDMPWSLYATASLLPAVRSPIRILSLPVFRGLHYAMVPTILATRLKEGFELLKALTVEDVISRGQEPIRRWLGAD